MWSQCLQNHTKEQQRIFFRLPGPSLIHGICSSLLYVQIHEESGNDRKDLPEELNAHAFHLRHLRLHLPSTL
jgi:hypothetical protein